MKNYSNWLKDEDAAQIIGCSTKTLRKLAQENKIETGRYQAPETGAWQTRYNPEDAQRIRLERNPQAQPFVLPPNNSQQTALQRADPAAMETLTRALIDRIAPTASAGNGILRPSDLRHKLYLSAEEAVAYTGLSLPTIRRALYERPGARLKRSGPLQSEVFRRQDLETL